MKGAEAGNLSADVLVIGGGVAGLAFAACLASLLRNRRSGLRIAVLESRPPAPLPATEPTGLRVLAIAPDAEALLAECQVWQSLPHTRRAPYERMRVWQQGSAPDGRGSISFDAADLGLPALGHIVEHDWLRMALWRRLEAGPGPDQSGVELISGETPETLQRYPDRAELRLAGGGRVVARLVVAADGADSWVRTQLDLATTGRSYGQTAIVAHVVSERPHQRTAWQCFTPRGPVALLPLADGRSSLVWSAPDQQAAELLAGDDEHFSAQLTAIMGPALGGLRVDSARLSFPLAARHVHRYTGARFALIGDAAHQIHPLAGQGINLGLQDAGCLARVLADHLAGSRYADPGDALALRRYERQRKGPNLLNLATMEGLHRLFSSEWAAVTSLVTAGLGLVDRMPAVKRLLAVRATGARGPAGTVRDSRES